MVAIAGLAGGAVSGLGSLIGGSTAAAGQQQAAQTEAAATQAAIQAELSMFNTTQGNLAPFVGYGTEGMSDLLTEMNTPGFGGIGGTAGGTAPPLGGIPNITDPSQLPGYQFTLNQGLNATKNAAAAQGLGNSGAVLKGIDAYNQGLASSNYSQFLNNYWTNQNNRYNMLYNQVLTGQAAAANVGQAATSTGGNIASSTLSGAAGVANAQAAAATAQGAGFTGAGSSLGNALTTAALLGNTGTTIGAGSGGNVLSGGTNFSGGGDVGTPGFASSDVTVS